MDFPERVFTSVQRSVLVAGLLVGGCSASTQSPEHTAAPAPPRFEFVTRARPPASPAPDESEPAKPPRCPDPPAGALASVSCDVSEIVLAREVAFHPGRSIPPAPARAALDRVAELLRERDDILLVRVEAYSSRRVGSSPDARRHEIAESQLRADAILRYLWRRGRISAERLEAVGYGADPRFEGHEQRWPVVLRILQRTRVP